jgi:hypothetical protein
MNKICYFERFGFSWMGFVLFYFMEELLFVEQKNWNEELSSYAQNVR